MKTISSVLASVVLLGSLSEAAAQAPPRAQPRRNWMVLQVVASIPKAPFGLQVLALRQSRLGYFVSVKTGWNDKSNSPNFFDITQEEAEQVLGDTVQDTAENWLAATGGPTLRIAGDLYLQAGLGFGFESQFRKYSHDFGGGPRSYWIRANDSTITFSASAALNYRVGGRFFASAGGDYNPSGVHVAFGYGW